MGVTPQVIIHCMHPLTEAINKVKAIVKLNNYAWYANE